MQTLRLQYNSIVCRLIDQDGILINEMVKCELPLANAYMQ